MDTQNDPNDILEDVGQEVEAENVETTPEGEQEAPVPSAEETTEVTEQDELPESSNSRTREQFEKLTEKNKELARKLEEYERRERYGSSVLDENSNTGGQRVPSLDDYQHLTTQQAENIAQDFIDNEGNVDINGLNSALRQANARAEAAERKVQQVAQTVEQAEQNRQLEEAYKEASWLDPNSNDFDPKKYNLVRDRLTRYYRAGQKPRLLNVVKELEADLGDFSTPTKEKEKQVVEAYKQKQTAKAQASNVGTSSRREPVEDRKANDLVQRTRHGDKGALLERLKSYEDSLKK